MEEGNSAFNSFTNNFSGKRPLIKLRPTWEDSMLMDLEEISEILKKYSTQDMNYWKFFVNAVMNLWPPYAIGLVTYLFS